jgi:hypothetical protein
MIVLADFALVIGVQMGFGSQFMFSMSKTAVVAPFTVTSSLKILANLSFVFEFIAFQHLDFLAAFAGRQRRKWFGNLRLLGRAATEGALLVTSCAIFWFDTIGV